MKTCTKCKLEKDEAEFYTRADTGKRRDGCKVCRRAYRKSYDGLNREKVSARAKKYRRENREEYSIYGKAYRDKNRKQLDAKNRSYRESNREQILARKKAHYQKNRDRILAAQRRYFKENPGKRVAYLRQSIYGVSPEGFNRMLVEQGTVCAICKGPGGKKGLGVDHDHATGKVRSLLCSKCNMAIGLLNDSSAVVQQALSYLKSHGK